MCIRDSIYGCYECCYLQVVWNAGTPQTPLWQWGGGAPGNANVGHGARACLGDLDADGDPDFVGTNFSGVIWGAMNNGTPQAPYWDSAASVPGIGTGDSSGKLALADLDGDGDLDIVGATSFGRLKCWENLGTPQTWSFAESPGMLTGITQPTNGIHGIALPDVDCDGDADLLVAGWSSLEYLYLNERITPVRPCTWGTIKAIYR